jgi:hypothetical protein
MYKTFVNPQAATQKASPQPAPPTPQPAYQPAAPTPQQPVVDDSPNWRGFRTYTPDGRKAYLKNGKYEVVADWDPDDGTQGGGSWLKGGW